MCPASKHIKTILEKGDVIKLEVNGLGGPLCTVQISSSSQIRALKRIIAELAGIPQHQQRLFNGETELSVGTLRSALGASTEISLVRGQEEVKRSEMQLVGSLVMAKAQKIAASRRTSDTMRADGTV